MFPGKVRWLIGAVLLLVLVAAGVWWFLLRGSEPRDLIQYLPQEDTVLVYVDLSLWRKTGLLDRIAGEATTEDEDYRQFVDATGFNYRADLDAAAAAIGQNGNYFALRGRFDRGRIESYVRSQGGDCRDGLCKAPGSVPEHKISLRFPQQGVLVMAASADPEAVRRMGAGEGRMPPVMVDSSAWIYVPASWTQESKDLPLLWSRIGAALDGVRYAVFSWQALPSPRMELAAPAEGEVGARTIVSKLEELTKTAGAFDWLPRFVKQGRFRAEANVVRGEWPIVLEP